MKNPTASGKSLRKIYHRDGTYHYLDDGVADGSTDADESGPVDDSSEVQPAEYCLLDRLLNFLLIQLPLTVIACCFAIYVTCGGILWFATGSNHGSNLNEFTVNTADHSYEVYGLFKNDGTKVYEVTQYNTGEVKHDYIFNAYCWIMNWGNYTSAHTHPGDAPFSFGDLGNIQDHFMPSRMLVISPNYVYSLEPRTTWPSNAEVCEYLAQIESDIIRYNYKNYSKYQLFLSFDNDSIGILSSDTFMKYFAAEFDLIYKVTPIDEWDFS